MLQLSIMRQIILFNEFNKEYEVFKKLLNAELTIEISEIDNIDQLQMVIPILPDLDLIIASASPKNGNELKKIEETIAKIGHKTRFFVLGKYHPINHSTKLFPLKPDWNEVLSELKSIVLEHQLQDKAKDLPSFVPINFEFIKSHYKLTFPTDIYVRIKISPNEFQYVKRLHKNESFSDTEINNLISHNVEYLYITGTDYPEMLTFSLKQIIDDKKVISDTRKKIISQDLNFHITKEAINLVGVSNEVVEAVSKGVSEMELAISENNALSEFIKTLKENKLSYSYAHTYLLSIILSKVVASFQWDSKSIRERICYAAYFHDISLKDDRLIQIHSDEELYREIPSNEANKNEPKKRLYTSIEIENVNNHALDSSIILDKFKEIPMGVSQVIKEHHGMKSGIGFNDQQSISIQPLSMIFIVCEDFVHQFLELKEITKPEVQRIAANLVKKYNKSNYCKAAEQLEAIIPK